MSAEANRAPGWAIEQLTPALHRHVRLFVLSVAQLVLYFTIKAGRWIVQAARQHTANGAARQT